MKPATVVYKSFPEAGYAVIRTPEILFTFDYGPLGMAPLYNHGHADALSITLSVNGDLLIVDPGTYAYNGVPEFRRYFKGTPGAQHGNHRQRGPGVTGNRIYLAPPLHGPPFRGFRTERRSATGRHS